MEARILAAAGRTAGTLREMVHVLRPARRPWRPASLGASGHFSYPRPTVRTVKRVRGGALARRGRRVLLLEVGVLRVLGGRGHLALGTSAAPVLRRHAILLLLLLLLLRRRRGLRTLGVVVRSPVGARASSSHPHLRLLMLVLVLTPRICPRLVLVLVLVLVFLLPRQGRRRRGRGGKSGGSSEVMLGKVHGRLLLLLLLLLLLFSSRRGRGCGSSFPSAPRGLLPPGRVSARRRAASGRGGSSSLGRIPHGRAIPAALALALACLPAVVADRYRACSFPAGLSRPKDRTDRPSCNGRI